MTLFAFVCSIVGTIYWTVMAISRLKDDRYLDAFAFFFLATFIFGQPIAIENRIKAERCAASSAIVEKAP
jgi:hypothetical protein